MAFVYVLQSGDDNYFKIGRTEGEIEKRRKDLSTGNPKPLTLFDSIETSYASLVENLLHKKFFQYLSKEGDAKEFYVVDPEVLRKGLAEAKDFMAEYIPLLQEAEKFKQEDNTEEVKAADDEVVEIYKKLCSLRGQMQGLVFEVDVLENRLKNKIGKAAGIDGVATWKTQLRTALDQAALKERHPEIYEACLKQQKSRVFKLL